LSWLRTEKYSPGLDALLEYRDYLVAPAEELGLGLSRSSANRKFATVRTFLGWLQSRGFMKENPAIWVKNFRAKTESPTQGFSDSQVALILSAPNLHTRSGIMHSLILHILFYMGLRRSEVTLLRASHFGQSRVGENVVTTLRVQGKGDKERLLPLPEAVLPILEEYFRRTGLSYGMDRPLFCAVKNNVSKKILAPLNTNTIAYIVKKYARKVGVDAKVSPHSCRATCISNALDQGASHRSVQQMAGWSSPLMIERYDKRETDLAHSAVHIVRYPA
jgi:site-specific recombinase XerD